MTMQNNDAVPGANAVTVTDALKSALKELDLNLMELEKAGMLDKGKKAEAVIKSAREFNVCVIDVIEFQQSIIVDMAVAFDAKLADFKKKRLSVRGP